MRVISFLIAWDVTLSKSCDKLETIESMVSFEIFLPLFVSSIFSSSAVFAEKSYLFALLLNLFNKSAAFCDNFLSW